MIKKKICMLGAFAVGKTSLVQQYVHSIFSEKYQTTVGVKIDKKTLLPKLLLLQGVNAEPEELEDGLAFSIAIHVDTGRMAAAVSTTETVYSMMGSCHAL